MDCISTLLFRETLATSLRTRVSKQFFFNNLRDIHSMCVTRATFINVENCEGSTRGRALSILFLFSLLFVVSSTRDQIIVPIDSSRSIAFKGSSVQVFSTHRNSNRWKLKSFSSDALNETEWRHWWLFYLAIAILTSRMAADVAPANLHRLMFQSKLESGIVFQIKSITWS